MQPMGQLDPGRLAKRRARSRGAETIEFTFVLLPLFCILFVLFDASWAIFVKATLQYAVRVGVRTGITITGTQATAAGETLTNMVKDTVQRNALGLLTGTTGRAYIVVTYLQQDSSSSTGVSTIPGTQTKALPGNILEVSIQNYPLPGLLPRFYSWLSAPDMNPSIINVFSADLIEPSADTATI